MFRWLIDLVVQSTRLQFAKSCDRCGMKMSVRTDSPEILRKVRSTWDDLHATCGAEYDY